MHFFLRVFRCRTSDYQQHKNSLPQERIYNSASIVEALNCQFLGKSQCDCQLSGVYRRRISPSRASALYPPRGKSSVFKTALGMKRSEELNMSKQRSFLLNCYSKLRCLRPTIRLPSVSGKRHHVLQGDRTYLYILELSRQPIYGLSFMINWRSQLLDLSHQVIYNFLQHKKASVETLYRFLHFITGLSLAHYLSTPNFKPPMKLRPQYKHVKEQQEICC